MERVASSYLSTDDNDERLEGNGGEGREEEEGRIGEVERRDEYLLQGVDECEF